MPKEHVGIKISHVLEQLAASTEVRIKSKSKIKVRAVLVPD